MKNSNEKEEIDEQKRGSTNQSQTYEYNNTYDPEYNPLPLPSLSKNQINYSTLKDFIDQKDLKLNENTLKRIKVAQDGRIVLARKGNPHVSSACLNCRKSHLACDCNSFDIINLSLTFY
ncbi:hypothetical protein K502DRAFT_325224 [Neoconidiobolus thromboides FSU 785]|nr:hypothetical protein K502DRAFT_325224 [Neoconidiobolus thromboides FSU 785]